jgi:hypothetical protein
MNRSTKIKVDKIITATVRAAEVDEPLTQRQMILDEASEIVHNDRNNFNNSAAAWNAYLNPRQDAMHRNLVTAADVAVMCILIKTARLSTNPTHHDSCVDIAGYAACLGDVQSAMFSEAVGGYPASVLSPTHLREQQQANQQVRMEMMDKR